MLEDLGDIGPLRALQYLYLQNCRLLKSLRDLYSPFLKVLDLSGCSKLEDLGSFDSLGSLQILNLSECVSLRTIPSLQNSSCLEVLNLKGCSKLSALSQMTTPEVVIDVSECWSLERIPILNDLSKLELDVTVGDMDRKAAKDMALSGVVQRLILKCQNDSLETRNQSIMNMLRLKGIETQKQLEGIMEILRSGDVEMQILHFKVLIEILLSTKRRKQGFKGIMKMLRSEDTWIKKQGVEGIIQVLRFTDCETHAQGIKGCMEMFEQLYILNLKEQICEFQELYEEAKIQKQCIIEKLWPKDVEKWQQGIVEALRFKELKTDIEDPIEILLPLQGEPWIQRILNMLEDEKFKLRVQGKIYEKLQMWKKVIIEVLRIPEAQAQKQDIMDTRSQELNLRKPSIWKMLGSEEPKMRNQGMREMLRPEKPENLMQELGMVKLYGEELEGIMGMLRSQELEMRKRGIMKVLRSEKPEIWKQGITEMLWSEELELWEQCIVKMCKLEDLELWKRSMEMLRSEELELWKQGIMEMCKPKKSKALEMLEVLVNSHDMSLAMTGQTPENENGFVILQACDYDVQHFKNVHGLLKSSEWMQWQPVFPQSIHVKFSSISISSERLTILPISNFFSTVSRLEIINCRQLRHLSTLGELPALETLVISHCDELENLPDLGKSTVLKHLTIRNFRQGPRFQFLSHLCQPLHAYPTKWMPCFIYKSLVELNFDNCVGLGGLEHWGPLPALESLVINNCSTITQLPNLQNSPRLSNVIVMNCERFREVVNLGFGGGLRVVRIEGCGNEKLTNISSRKELRSGLKKVLNELHGFSGTYQLNHWLKRGESDSRHLDMFRKFKFEHFQFTGPTLERFNLLMKQWALCCPN